jgi:hypothetical protein
MKNKKSLLTQHSTPSRANEHSLEVSLGGLVVIVVVSAPMFAGSNAADDEEFLKAIKSVARLPSEWNKAADSCREVSKKVFIFFIYCDCYSQVRA